MWPVDIRFTMSEALFSSVEELARHILAQARKLVENLTEIATNEGLKLPVEKFQDAFISFSQILLLAYLKSYSDLFDEEAEQELFLLLARFTLEELLLREPAESEFEYFLAYYRSHLELLKKELEDHRWEPPLLEGEALQAPQELLSFYLERLFTQEGKVRH